MAVFWFQEVTSTPVAADPPSSKVFFCSGLGAEQIVKCTVALAMNHIYGLTAYTSGVMIFSAGLGWVFNEYYSGLGNAINCI